MLRPIFEVARELAEAHRAEDPETKSVFLADSVDEVRLVEVSGSVGTSGEVLPFRFAPRPDLGVPYASVVVLLSEDDLGARRARRAGAPTRLGKSAHPREDRLRLARGDRT
ncbi:MAG: hypothetical protein IT374_13880 [Polyangiaceae bacterium]|nr:hypothetical protein [Polyangiaceae bacterium]